MATTKKFCYPYPRPAVTADIVLFRAGGAGDEILLIKRKKDPFGGYWAIPGGFVDEDEPLEAAAKRELEEETGIKGPRLRQFGAFGDPGRDPRGHTVSIAFYGDASNRVKAKGGDDAADAQWFPVAKLPRLAFDHRKIVKAAMSQREKEKAEKS